MPSSKKVKKKKTGTKKNGARKPRESLTKKKDRALTILNELEMLYPNPECALDHNSALQLLVATILSAQCTDERVNMVTPALFDRYNSADAFADAQPAELEALIQSTGFYRNKAKNIIGAGQVLVRDFDGNVPDNMDDLLTLPGVARKTANVILGTWFEKNEGFVVDTHIGRLAHRFDLTWTSRDSKDAVKIERDLMQVFPQDRWTDVGHMFILHGRAICNARKPLCDHCTLTELCPSAFEHNKKTNAKAGKKKKSKRRGKSKRR